MAWQPQPGGLEQILQLLRESQSIDCAVQHQVQSKLEEWNKYPDFNNYLIYILTNPATADETTRSLSGLILKNNVRTSYQSFPDEVREYIKRECLNSLRDSSSIIRATVGIIITTIASCGELVNWTELLPTLYQLICSEDHAIVEGAFGALQKICEDLADVLCSDTLSKPLEAMLPKFIQFFKHPSAKVRYHALICVNQFIPIQAEAIMNIIDQYVEAIFTLASDTDTEVKKHVCRSLVALFEIRPDTLLPHISQVIEVSIVYRISPSILIHLSIATLHLLYASLVFQLVMQTQ